MRSNSPSIGQTAPSNFEDLSSWMSSTPELDITFGQGHPRLLTEVLDSLPARNTNIQQHAGAIAGTASSSLDTSFPLPNLLPDLLAFDLSPPTDTTHDHHLYPNSKALPTLLPPRQHEDLDSKLTQSNGGTRLIISPSRHVAELEDDAQIESIAPWDTITFFIGLYLGYLHSLAPIVHRPSFSQDLATRRDRWDKDFRALCLGIGEFV